MVRARWRGRLFTATILGPLTTRQHRAAIITVLAVVIVIPSTPTYRHALGRPLIRMSYNFHENDYKLAKYVGDVLGRLAKAINPT